MRHWSQLAIRNWRARLPRTLGAVVAVALGTAAVVWVACCYESVRVTIARWAGDYIGTADVTVASPLGKYDQIPQRVARMIADVENVASVTPRLLQRFLGEPWPASRPDIPSAPAGVTPEIDIHGIDLESEHLVRSYRLSAGRMLAADDNLHCVMEAQFARQWQVGVGDLLLVWTTAGQPPQHVEVVGLFDKRRVARFQKPIVLMRLPVLQRIATKFALITDVSIVLDNRSGKDVRQTRSAIYRRIRPTAPNAQVRDTEARLKQVETAQANQRILLTMLSYVAMLTAAFIIVSTLSMGMVERVRELGLMRCVGVTRRQIASLMLLEVLPLGLLGVLVGVPLGLALTALTVWLVPEYVGFFSINWEGIGLASAAGVATTLLAGVVPMIAAVRVAPLEAAHPQGRPARAWWIGVATAVAVAAFAAQRFGVLDHARRSLTFLHYAVAAIVLLYIAYALLAPLLVRLVGAPATWLAAGALRVRGRLLADQVAHATWRAAGMSCGIMVGLSLIVAVIAVNESIRRGWQFPRHFPAAYLWSFEPLPLSSAEALARTPGIEDFTWGNSINVIVEERPLFGEQLLMSVTWFMGIHPESFFRLVQLDFVEGDQADAIAKLEAGGYILVADDFSRSRDKHLGDKVRVFVGTRSQTFEVAGVIRSPAIDIAAGYFQLQSEYSVMASGSVIGAHADLRERFGEHALNFAFMNFNLPPEPVPADWPPTEGGRRLLAAEYYDEAEPLTARWQRYREGRVLAELQRGMRAPIAFTGTVSELKAEIDRGLAEMTRLFTAIPVVALLVAVVGVANLMTANVTARARQFAILRAVGATRALVLRMVLGEALVLGLLGCLLGLALGLHLSSDITELVARMWGFQLELRPPWGYLGGAAALTVALCAVAGILPARRAARTDVVAALHVP